MLRQSKVLTGQRRLLASLASTRSTSLDRTGYEITETIALRRDPVAISHLKRGGQVLSLVVK
jgi:hypothetical protein